MGLENIAELQVRGDVIEIRAPRNEPRAGWAADAQRLSNTDEGNLLWPEFGNADDADLKW